MLLVHAQFESAFAIRVERKQVKIIVGAAVQDVAAEINGRINKSVNRAAFFRLDVEGGVGDRHVRVVTELHFPVRFGLREGWSKPGGIFPPYLTQRRLHRYYSNSPMSDSGLHTYAPLLLHLLIATGLAGALTIVSVLVGWRRPSRAKQQPYECGMEPTGDAREPFSVKFYLVAMVFILFDVEAIFLYPWAYIFRSLRWYGFVEMMIYIGVLLVGYLYLWKKGALDWHK
jgi:NADH-quinone oxidoreductase subunit A